MNEPQMTPGGSPSPAGDDGAKDPVPTLAAFVVWLNRDTAGQFKGTVERARTGEKHQFDGLESLGSLIARMSEGERQK
jgi:hypothetical protein